MIKNLDMLNEHVQKGYIYGLGAGFDGDEKGEFLYIQTTCEEKYEKLMSSIPLLEIYNPSKKDIQMAKKLLEQLSQQYSLPVTWNHL